jgi:hypothetical protein
MTKLKATHCAVLLERSVQIESEVNVFLIRQIESDRFKLKARDHEIESGNGSFSDSSNEDGAAFGGNSGFGRSRGSD